MGNGYTEKDGDNIILKNYLIPILFIGLVAGILISYSFPRIFPKNYEKITASSRIFYLVFVLILSCCIAGGTFLFINASLGKRSILRIDGLIERKWWTSSSKSRTYYLGLRDTSTGNYYEFRVRKNIYEQIGETGDRVSKEFRRGSLGVIYRFNY